MSFGMRIWGENGALQIDETTFTMRVVFSELVTYPTFTKSIKNYAIPGVTPDNAIAVFVPIGSIYQTGSTRFVQFETQILNGSVNVYNYNRGVPISSLSSAMGTQRLIVMRIR